MYELDQLEGRYVATILHVPGPGLVGGGGGGGSGGGGGGGEPAVVAPGRLNNQTQAAILVTPPPTAKSFPLGLLELSDQSSGSTTNTSTTHQ